MIRIASAGGYDKLVYFPLADGEYTEGANIKLNKDIKDEDLVIVKTYACGVNYADVCIRWGLYESAKKFVGWPITPGFEFSGEIESKGENVKEFEIGDKVFGVSLFGGYSKRIRVPKRQLFKLPEKLDEYEAAGFLTVALTAWYGMFELARPRAGSLILVHSAAGGVGTMLVQLAKISGCRVVGVVGASHKVDHVKQLGCDHVIDKSKEDLWKAAESFSAEGYQVVFDANGVETLQESYMHLAPGGKLVVYGFHTMLPRSSEGASGAFSLWQWIKLGWNYRSTPTFNPLTMTSENKSVMAFNLSFLFDRDDILKESMSQLLYWEKQGTLKVGKVTKYPLKLAGKAHRDLESGQTIGKLVLTMEEDELKAEQ
ncbi:synaptic vesicle membrane protein VAT-1 homolog [Montipora foliosa]|uniref:synaptic vesicle membrane protein VAT-1 homolog n=1 Tax=Montipora foliosa TaxID=591990 RepID=UPI0035F11AE8